MAGIGAGGDPVGGDQRAVQGQVRRPGPVGSLTLRAATGEHRLAACIADPALFGIAEGMQARMRAMGVPDAVVQRLSHADEATLAGMAADMQRSRIQRWTIEQRGFWVHGVRTLPDYIRVAAQFTLAGRVDRIDCPTLLCAAQDDKSLETAQDNFVQAGASATDRKIAR